MLSQDPIQDWNRAMKNAMEDVVSAIDWIKANSKQYGVDKNKIILAGYSAGAEIVTNVAYGSYVNISDRDCISGVVDISGNTLFWGDALKKRYNKWLSSNFSFWGGKLN
jgi:acetyl esterase/lipase